MAMTRRQAVAKLYNDTSLPPKTILGTFALLDKAKLPLRMEWVVAAAFSAYKTYETETVERVSAFQDQIVPVLRRTNLKADELRVLKKVGWVMPPRTRIDCVETLGHELGAGALDVGRAVVLSLLVPECDKMNDDQYARVMLCSAVQINRPEDRAWMAGLPSKTVPRDYILRWGLRMAALARPTEGEVSVLDDSKAPRGVKRKRT